MFRQTFSEGRTRSFQESLLKVRRMDTRPPGCYMIWMSARQQTTTSPDAFAATLAAMRERIKITKLPDAAGIDRWWYDVPSGSFEYRDFHPWGFGPAPGSGFIGSNYYTISQSGPVFCGMWEAQATMFAGSFGLPNELHYSRSKTVFGGASTVNLPAGTPLCVFDFRGSRGGARLLSCYDPNDATDAGVLNAPLIIEGTQTGRLTPFYNPHGSIDLVPRLVTANDINFYNWSTRRFISQRPPQFLGFHDVASLGIPGCCNAG